MFVREVTRDDAAPLARLLKHVDASNVMLFHPGERKISLEGLEKHIQNIQHTPHSRWFVAVAANETRCGYVFIMGNDLQRTRHRASVVIGVEERARGQGVGSQLIHHAETWAENAGVHRLELTTLVHNHAAISLYSSLGYEREGIRYASLCIDDVYHDEIYFYKLLT
ncbi:GNAT family N-acetyltransferase [Geomicrobium sp. JCM 19039]|uniref:GNAT family N-acetyltransferase n=1 Tax=Geomicrobium sp. JCM 19039 TaxID=1460636 RepID=UPI00045F1974|nr:GNAT family N-acetyltransferase [Geomicrobium sp. JCM 19039]GAK11580.1 acetyltransferase [Geomicrobium sp. JCM 19039]